MKKYTKRLKEHIHEWRVAKNWCAIFILLANALNTLATKGSWETVLSSFGIAVGIIVIGETLHHLGMSWVETAELIQENGNRELPIVDSDCSISGDIGNQ